MRWGEQIWRQGGGQEGPPVLLSVGLPFLLFLFFYVLFFFFWTCLNFCTSRLHETLHFYGNSYYTDFYLAPKCFWGLTRKRTLKALVLIIHSLFLLVLTVEVCTHSLIKLLWHMTWRGKFVVALLCCIFFLFLTSFNQFLSSLTCIELFFQLQLSHVLKLLLITAQDYLQFNWRYSPTFRYNSPVTALKHLCTTESL